MSSERKISPIDWPLYGMFTGASMAILELPVAAATGFRLPLEYLITIALVDATLGFLIGTTIGSVHAALGNRRVSLRTVWSCLAVCTTFLFFVDVAALAALHRNFPFWVGVAMLAVVLSITYFVMAWISHRCIRRQWNASLFLMATVSVPIYLVGGKVLTRTYFGSYASAGAIVIHSAGAVIGLTMLIIVSRLLPSKREPRPMMSRRWASGGLVGLVSMTLVCWHETSARDPSPPIERRTGTVSPTSIVLISIDTLRADHLSIYGYEKNIGEHLARLAEDGVVFTNAISPANWTLPAHASLLTGNFPRRHAAHRIASPRVDAEHAPSAGELLDFGEAVARVSRPLSTKSLTLAEVLSQRGYRTSGIVANSAMLHRTFGFAQGFENYDDQERMYLGYEPVANSFLQFFPLTFYRLTKPYRLAEDINRAAYPWLDLARHEPVFLFLNYMDPHGPYSPPAPFHQDYIAARDSWLDLSQTPFKTPSRFTKSEESSLLSLYDGEISYADHHVGALVAKMKDLGIYDEALIIVTSDHGEFFGEHDKWSHMVGPYDEVHRVPLIVKYPHSQPQGVEHGAVQPLDAFSTILKLVGVPIPEGTDGIPLLESAHPIMTEHYESPAMNEHFAARNRGYRALYEPPWKLVLYADGSTELYDLGVDRGESRDLSQLRRDIVGNMRDRLEEYVSSIEPIVGRDASLPAPSDEELKRLKSLGYMN